VNTALAELFRHNLWANCRLLDSCAGLSDELLDASTPGTFGRVRDTLRHIVDAEEGYLPRHLHSQQPEQPGSPTGDLPGIEGLRERATRSGNALIGVAERFQPGEVFRVPWDNGDVYDVPAVVFLVQAINHATKHRAQVLTILGQRGTAVPDLSAWGYWEDTNEPVSVHRPG